MQFVKLDKMKTMIEAFDQKSIISPEKYLEQWSDLNYQLSEGFSSAYIDYTLHTQDQKKKDIIKEFQDLMEFASQCYIRWVKNFLAHLQNYPKAWEYMIQTFNIEIKLFHPDNPAIQTKIENLSRNYQEIINGSSILHEGKEYTLSAAFSFLENPDRVLRETFWSLILDYLEKQHHQIEDLFSKQIQYRHRIAQNAQHQNYRDFSHQSKLRLNYSVEDVLQFHDTVESTFVPLYTKFLDYKKQVLNIKELKYFDLTVPLDGPPTVSFHSEKELIDNAYQILSGIHPEVGEYLLSLKKEQHLDLLSKKGKAHGGYNIPLPLSNSSFIFMNATHSHQDLMTLIHEMGHAYHHHFFVGTYPFPYTYLSSESAELASMSMELMSMAYWNTIYDEKEIRKAQLMSLEGILRLFPWMSCIDLFQQQIYVQPNLSINKRNEIWLDIFKKYYPFLEMTVQEEEKMKLYWQKQLHIIEVPFYYIEYGIAQIGALQILSNYQKNPSQTFEQYREALKLGGSVPFHQMYHQAGIKSPFEDATIIKTVSEFLETELNHLM